MPSGEACDRPRGHAWWHVGPRGAWAPDHRGAPPAPARTVRLRCAAAGAKGVRCDRPRGHAWWHAGNGAAWARDGKAWLGPRPTKTTTRAKKRTKP